MLLLRKTTLAFLSVFSIVSYSQVCGVEQTIVICDMGTIDGNGDGSPDGIVNLYDLYFDETGNNLDTGTWSIENVLSIPLNENTGDVSLWDYEGSSSLVVFDDPFTPEDESEPFQDYTFQLFTDSCGNTPAASISIEIGPFSGVALPPSGTTDINFEVCEGTVNLFEALVSNEVIPSPHSNGVWERVSPIPSNAEVFLFTPGTDYFYTEIEYQSGLPLVDNAIFEFKYVVPESKNCAAQETNVTISVIRQVSAGTPTDLYVCESDILEGLYDSNIDLSNSYLFDQDDEGFWSVSDNGASQIDDVFDSIINISDLYDELILNRGARFGSETYTFTYDVPKRSGVCSDSTASINVSIYEEIREFAQSTTENNEICLNDATQSTTINLIDFVEFGNESGVIYDYPTSSNDTSWSVVSSPLVIDDFQDGVFYLFQDGQYVLPGTYVFNFEVRTSVCPNLSTNVTIEVLPFDYTGEDTDSILLCEADESVVLTSLMEANSLRGTVVTTGTWTNTADGSIVDNNFELLEVEEDTDYEFTYSTTHATSGCVDEATLSFTVVNQSPAGSSGTPITDDGIIKVCSDDLNIKLFDQLENADTTGTWTGPAAYVSTDHEAEFVFNNLTLPRLVEGDYTYTVESNEFCVITQTTTITIEFVDPITLDAPAERTFCKTEASIDLASLLGTTIPTTGVYSEVNTSGVLTGSVVDFSSLTSETYTFEYTLDNEPCGTPVQQFLITVIDDSNPPTAGTGPVEPIFVCEDNRTITLFDYLEDNPSTSGIWTGPFTYVSANHLGEFNQNNENLPILGAGVYTYTVGGGVCNTPIFTSTVEVEFVSPVALGGDIFDAYCKLDQGINLYSLLDQNTTREGTFMALDTDQSVIDEDGNLSFDTLSSDIYNFEYSVPNIAPCEVSTLNIEITIYEVEQPQVENTEFCILNAATLTDLEFANADVSDIIFYSSLLAEEPILNNIILQDEDTYYASLQDANGCESERVEIQVSILNIGEDSSCTIEFQDGVSANGDMTNDTFALDWSNDQYNVAEAFPQFELEIYNRYGVVVFRGNADTEEFRGIGNVSLSLGSDLPSGTYFYLFKPNVLNNLPIQGSFYLSK